MRIDIIDFDKKGKSAIILKYDIEERIIEEYEDELDECEMPVMTAEAHALLQLREGNTIKTDGTIYTVVDAPEFDIDDDVWTIYVMGSVKKKKPRKKKGKRGTK